jgi:sugar lactone lactonase YvrE
MKKITVLLMILGAFCGRAESTEINLKTFNWNANNYSNFIELSFSTINNPSVTSFSPTSGLIGTTVTISGNNFSTVVSENLVEFNGITAEVTAASENNLTVLVPENASTGAIHITVNNVTVISSSVFTVLTESNCNGISKNYANNWYFGNQAAIKFENNVPAALTNSAMSQVEGVATISDANGNLLFYTNGITIYNRNHQIMVNGTGLTSHSSNTQAAFIVPFPENPNKYYVITPDPYYYSIVDMTLDNGNGAVQTDAKNILISQERSEKVAGLLASNQTDIWLITYGASQMRFNVYKITPDGITTSPVVSQFATASGYYGYMKISPDGTKIAMANFNNTFHLYDFNAATGIVSNQRIMNINVGGFGSYGIEFSPNNNLVYVADHRGQNRVYQYDITLATPALIAASVVPLATNAQALGGIQLGPDNKIYVARENAGFLGVINNPNVVGADCNYVADGVSLSGKTSNLGLPGFVASSLVQNQPYISSFSPISGEVGDTVIISGTDFSTLVTNNSVTFNGVQATVVEATSTTLTVIVPTDATTGEISIESGCNIVASTDDFTISNLSTNDFDENTVKIAPNPTTGIVSILNSENKIIDKIEVVDVLGKIVYEKYQNTTQIDISSVSKGMYIINLYAEGNKTQKRIIKN